MDVPGNVRSAVGDHHAIVPVVVGLTGAKYGIETEHPIWEFSEEFCG
jgi:hypothetical protein